MGPSQSSPPSGSPLKEIPLVLHVAGVVGPNILSEGLETEIFKKKIQVMECHQIFKAMKLVVDIKKICSSLFNYLRFHISNKRKTKKKY